LPSIESLHRHLRLGNYIADLQHEMDVETTHFYEEFAESIDGPQLWRKDVSDAFVDLRRLVRILNSSSHIQRQEMENIWYSDMVYSLKRRLVSLSNAVGNRRTQTTHIEVPCCTAALILIEVCFRGIGLDSRIIGRFVTRQRTLMEPLLADVSLILTSPAKVRALLWALCISGIAAEKRPERQWFVTQLVWFCSLLEINHWRDMEAVLNDVLWQPGWELPYTVLWDEVRIARVRMHEAAYSINESV
jgi:hypothetical protein